ncbi:MAG: hypothetical protein ACO22Y_00215 [Sediminibacterium sp.]
MKLEELRKVIREEIKLAFREELKDVLIEAVQIASTPSNVQVESVSTPAPQSKPSLPKQPAYKPTGNPLEDMLQMTKASMTKTEASNFLGESTGAVIPNLASTTASQLGRSVNGLPDFAMKAKAILDASYKKDKERHGV